jgi:hypothetical protein
MSPNRLLRYVPTSDRCYVRIFQSTDSSLSSSCSGYTSSQYDEASQESSSFDCDTALQTVAKENLTEKFLRSLPGPLETLDVRMKDKSETVAKLRKRTARITPIDPGGKSNDVVLDDREDGRVGEQAMGDVKTGGATVKIPIFCGTCGRFGLLCKCGRKHWA